MKAGLALAFLALAHPATAQQADLPRAGQVFSTVLTIDSERVFQESDFGRRVTREVEEQSQALATENRQIEAALEAEELALTEQRPSLSAEEFRSLADAFDQKVQQTRREQAAKGRALGDQVDREREVFLNAAAPVLEQLMREARATVILERRAVFVSASAIEITDVAIARLNETLGSGPAPSKP